MCIFIPPLTTNIALRMSLSLCQPGNCIFLDNIYERLTGWWLPVNCIIIGRRVALLSGSTVISYTVTIPPGARCIKK